MALVSVVIPMRNGEPFIRAALESVLAQEGVELEVVVVNDGSKDGSPDTVRSLGDNRVRLVDGPCQGISMSLNTGLAAARGDFIARCDADDLFPPGRLAWQMQWLAEHPDFDGICGRFSNIDAKGKLLANLDSGETAEEITEELRQGKTRTHLCTWTLRAEPLRRVGGCRPWFRTAEDIDLQLRLGEVARIWYEPRQWYLYRLHGASITHTDTNALRNFYEETARTFSAQRRGGQPDDLERGQPPPLPISATGSIQDAAKHIQGMLIGQAWDEHRNGRKRQALELGWWACRSAPTSWAAWKSLLALLIKPTPRKPS